MIRNETGHMGRIGARLGRLFPERQLVVRTNGRLRYVRVSRAAQVGVLALLLGAAGGVAFTAHLFQELDRQVAARDTQIANTRLAYQTLLEDVSDFQQRHAAINADLEKNHQAMMALSQENAELQESLQTVESRLKSTEEERAAIIANRETLKDQLSQIEDRMSGLASKNYSLRGNLSSVETNLQAALDERNRAKLAGQRLERRIAELQARFDKLAEAERDTLARLAERTDAQSAIMESAIQMTGLDLEALLASDDLPTSGAGGPFIAASLTDEGPGGEYTASLADLDAKITRGEALHALMERLPLSAPLTAYHVTSNFGKRRDPVNKKWAMHYGLDMGSTPKAVIHATAPGVVTQAGWKGRYGRFVEIDHGSGITTRYGHMRKIFVKKGQKVGFQDKIGLVGNSGRSTGAHLHYEIQYQGKPFDPAKFLAAGRHVFKG